MVLERDFPSTKKLACLRTMAPFNSCNDNDNNNDKVEQRVLPDSSINHSNSLGVTIINLSGGEFIVENDDVEIVHNSAAPSCSDDGSFNACFNLQDGQACNKVFMTSASAAFPNYETNHSGSISRRQSLVSAIIGNNFLGIGNGKDNSGSLTPNLSSPNLMGLGAGDSRASLISLGKKSIRKDETWLAILSQIGLPFLIAGLGMVGAGLLLDHVMEWTVFVEIGELVILVTPLLGLKGNLEMTLAARLSTHANIGNLNKSSGNKWKICSGNLILDQLQAIVCGIVSAMIAIAIGYIMRGKFEASHMSIVIVSSVLTASMVSLILGSTMISVILLSKKFKINPDNVATPVAGSLGDVVTLGMLSCFASVIYDWHQRGYLWIPYTIIGFYLIILPVAFFFAFRNEFTRPVCIAGWVPLIVSVCISTGGGILLDLASNRFPGVALYQPVINGIGGNLVSVQASRISSYLHGYCAKRILPDGKGTVCESPYSVFFSKGMSSSMSARLLLLLAIPGHLLFSTVTHFVARNEDTNFGPLFLTIYVSAAVIQVFLLLYIAKILTNLCWVNGIDPDSQTIPYLTATGDLFGSGLLFLAFELLSCFGKVGVSS